MAITKRGKRRLIALSVIILVLGASVAGLYVVQKARRAQAIEQAYVDGLAALEAEDFPRAVELLAQYANANTDNAQAWYDFARARLNVPEHRAQHIGKAMVALRHVLEIEPDHVDASQDLLALYANTGTNERALELADKILLRDPENAEAMRARASSLARMEQPEAALEAARARIAVDDRDWRTHLLALQLRFQLDEPAETLLQEALELNKRYPDEPQFELIVAFAHQFAYDEAQARLWLEQAAARTPPDANFLVMLVQFLDRAHMFGLSQQVLEREAKPDNEAGLFRESIRRAFEAGRSEQVLARLRAFERAQGELSVDDLALRALAHFDLEQMVEAQRIVADLRAYENEPLAAAWSEVLDAIGAPGSDRDARIIQACQSALQTYPNNAFFHAFLGNAYARAGELDLALPAWEKAAASRTPWAMPRLRRAQTLLDLNRVEEALMEAEAGYLRQPNHGGSAVMLASARGAYLEQRLNNNRPRDWEQQAEELLNLLNQIQQALPGEERTLQLKVRLLAQLDRREQAADEIRQILARDAETPLGDDTLLVLARTSARYELGLAEAIYERLGDREEQTPQVVYNQAIRLAQIDQQQHGLELLDQAIRSADQADRPAWQLARAQFLSAINDPSAGSAWIELADAFPDNVRVQEQALQAEAVLADRAFVDRAIERVRESLGDQGVTWRVARAQWLLTGPEAGRDPARAVVLMREVIEQAPDHVQPRLLLARAQQQLGLLPLAVREMNAAARLRPDSSAIALQLAVLHQELRHFRSARDSLQRVIANPGSTPAQLRSAAALLAQQGEDAAAMTVLERLNTAGELDQPGDQLLLAHLYRRTGQDARVAALLPALLEAPTPIMVLFAADYHAAKGEMEQAEQILARLDELELTPVERLLHVADFYASHRQSERALAAYREAVQAAPNHDDTWYRLLRFQVDQGDAAGALASAQQSLAARPNDEAIKQFVANARLVTQFTEFERLRPLVIALLNESEHRPAALRSLQLLAQTYDSGRPVMELARDLRTLADQHPNFAALQVIAARTHMQADRPAEAVRIAQRAVETFPTAVEPARTLAEALAAAGQWQEAIAAASAWRSRAGTHTLDPDLLIAEASLQTGRVNDALAAMAPYLEAARAQPDQHGRVLLSYARSLLAARRANEAAQLLTPTLAGSAQWRQNWMSLAATHIADRPTAAAWLEQVAQQIPDDAVDEQLALARSWWMLAERFGDATLHARAQAILGALVERADAGAAVWYFHGSLADASGDAVGAERAYRRALELDESLHVARNNLAMLLSAQPDTVSEALTHAQRIVAAQPTMPTYLDTLAHVQAKAGHCAEAVQSMEQAIQLDPSNPKWHANLAGVLEACGQTDQAAQVREQSSAAGH